MKSSEQNGNPAIDRVMLIFAELEKSRQSLGLRTIVQRTQIARSTVYRLLNSLEEHGMVRQSADGNYSLGSRILQLAESVTQTSAFFPFVRLLHPLLDRLALNLGEAHKVSVLERDAIMVVAGASGKTPHSLSYTVGEYLPLHAGGASKVLIASLSPDKRDAILPRKLEALTERTIIDRALLDRELETVSKQGWAHDSGEFSLSVCSFAAPIYNQSAEIIAALSIPYLAGTPPETVEKIKQAALSGAAQISKTIVSH
ncbi:IclR family transcriptional regulator [Thalassospira mesophila]|uniref:IclR family transcriptional regulator n=1 Tax=Thalassospira mesophila TaxID=1293891 RepID=A0A1Y2KWD4_9PROT|nr:IclR family transcriptional regulator [Thalassospira mesophila]OSQ36432.1 hypothetical protein TMES_18270 [Thalassospira mesophila]